MLIFELFPILRGRNAVLLPEQLSEIAGIAEAAGKADIRDSARRFTQLLCSLRQAVFIDVHHGRFADEALEAAEAFGLADVDLLRKLVDGDSLGKMLVDIEQYGFDAHFILGIVLGMQNIGEIPAQAGEQAAPQSAYNADTPQLHAGRILLQQEQLMQCGVYFCAERHIMGQYQTGKILAPDRCEVFFIDHTFAVMRQKRGGKGKDEHFGVGAVRRLLRHVQRIGIDENAVACLQPVMLTADIVIQLSGKQHVKFKFVVPVTAEGVLREQAVVINAALNGKAEILIGQCFTEILIHLKDSHIYHAFINDSIVIFYGRNNIVVPELRWYYHSIKKAF